MPADSGVLEPRRRGRAKWVWFGVGAVLMGLAVWAALRGGGLAAGLEGLRDAGVGAVLALVLLPIASWLLTSTLFWALTLRFGRVRWGEMTALIGAAWLFNNLPLRPGLVGRLAYHRLVNGVPVSASVRVLGEALLCTAVAAGLGLAVLAFASVGMIYGAASGGAAIVAGAVSVFVLGRTGAPLPAGLLALGVLLRLADLASWWARYWLLLDLAGVEVTMLQTAAITIASQVASLTPVQSGLREWAVGGVTSLVRGGGAALLAVGLGVDLLNRALEVAVSIPIGVVGSAAVARRISAHRANAAAAVRATENP